MKEKFKNLNDSFDISSDLSEIISPVESKVVESEVIESKTEKSQSIDDEILKDYEYTRGNLYSLIEKGQEAINGILELAQESEMPRAYEVAGQLIKNVGDVADKLMDLQKKLKNIDEVKSKGPTNVTNALFVGSTAELSKLIKAQSQNSKSNKE
jgi:predicted house-cleaning noncanonical NTP pyrophosphatase (MazG superfamily)